MSQLAVTRLVSSLLYGVSAHDPLTIALAAAILLVAAVFVALAPVYRASRAAPWRPYEANDRDSMNPLISGLAN